MRKLYTALFCILLGALGSYLTNSDVPRKAWSGITCTIPVILQNGTTADANQVMQDFNAVAACFANVATVSSVTCGPGLDGGTITGTGTCSLSASRRTSPTTASFLAGSGTYNVPAGVLWLEVHLIGGGAGGTGTSAGGGGVGIAGGSTCLGGPCGSGLYEAGGGGVGSNVAGSNVGGNGGTVGGSTNCTIGQAGNEGTGFISGNQGGPGGAGPYGGGAAKVYSAAGSVGSSGKVNTGAGGQGSSNGGAGGGGGAYCYAVIGNPVASYVYTIGAGGAGGTGGGGFAGGAGGSGCVYIIEHYN